MNEKLFAHFENSKREILNLVDIADICKDIGLNGLTNQIMFKTNKLTINIKNIFDELELIEQNTFIRWINANEAPENTTSVIGMDTDEEFHRVIRVNSRWLNTSREEIDNIVCYMFVPGRSND